MCRVGPGAAAAVRRREMALAREEKGRRERAAHLALTHQGPKGTTEGTVLGRVINLYTSISAFQLLILMICVHGYCDLFITCYNVVIMISKGRVQK